MNTPSNAHIFSALPRLFLAALVPIAFAGCSGLFDDLDAYEFDSPDASNQSANQTSNQADNQSDNQTNNQPDNQTDNQTDQCPTGETDCDGTCVDTDSDPSHCGDCQTTCFDDFGEFASCDGGQCVLSCPANSVQCSGECIDTDSDPDNCGDCGVTCSETEDCVSGDCVGECDPDAEFDWITGIDTDDYQFGGGSGDEDDPFLICSAQQLVDIGYPGNLSGYPWLDANFALTADIDMGQITDFDGLGNSTVRFSGTFDGNGHEISNLTIEDVDSSGAGLFRALEDASVTDLVLNGFEITSYARDAGALAGQAINSSISNIEVSDTKVTALGNGAGLIGKTIGDSITITDITLSSIDVTVAAATNNNGPRASLGGAVGRLTGTLSDVTASNIHVTGIEAIGGLVGVNSLTGNISTIAANGVVLTPTPDVETNETFDSFGGLVGRNRGAISQASITSMSFSLPTDDAPQLDDFFITNLGGLVGHNQNSGTIYQSGADINLDLSVGDNLGGLVGRNAGSITQSYAGGGIHSEQGVAIGGLVGSQYAVPDSGESSEIIDAYAVVDVYANNQVGGLVGQATAVDVDPSDDTTQPALINRCYAAGAVNSTSNGATGGFLGNDPESFVSIESSFWDNDASGRDNGTTAENDPEGLQSLVTEEFTDPNNFNEDWDFANTWVIGSAPDNAPRPIFQWQASDP